MVRFCIAAWGKIVLQDSQCIATGCWAGVYRNTIDCIVTEARHGLYCNTVTVPTTRPSLACGRAGVGASGTGVGPHAWACCRPTGCALGALSLFLTRFDSVLFLSQFLDIVREPGS